MTSATCTLYDFFLLADDKRSAQCMEALDDACSALDTQQPLTRDVAAALPVLLQVEFASVLAGAWKNGSELGRFADTGQYAPDETIHVSLTNHVVTSHHRPYLDVFLNDQSCGTLDFMVEIALRVEGAVLTIKDGMIWTATTGMCTASGRITCGGQILTECESAPVQFPRTLVFDQPIPIVPQPGGWEETPLA